ncbi:mRNA degradation ribonuclease J1/J2 [Bradyrhizobium japonicum]
MVSNPPRGIDTMLMEGSSLGRLDEHTQFPTEDDIEARLTQSFKQPGFVILSASAQNIDRIVSIYRACKRSGRTLLLDLYAMEILRATGNERLPNVGWPNLSVYVPEYQRRQIARKERFDLLDPYKSARIYPPWVGQNPPGMVT